jgi:hypothetical protein
MRETSDSSGGFAYEVAGNVVKVSGWGFWSEQICAAFASKVLDEFQSQGADTTVELSFGNLKPLRDAGQTAVKLLFDLARRGVIGHIEARVDSELTKLQLKRIAFDMGAGDVVTFP